MMEFRSWSSILKSLLLVQLIIVLLYTAHLFKLPSMIIIPLQSAEKVNQHMSTTPSEIHSIPITVEHTHVTQRALVSVAIGLGITTKNSEVLWNNTTELQLPFFYTFLKSFCRTSGSGFDYRFYLAYDFNDSLFKDGGFKKRVTEAFHNLVQNKYNCPKTSVYKITLVQCPYTGKPAWAQNDAMIAAYLDGTEYFFRVNDDTTLVTSGWTETFINVLQHYMPPNIGVVGPNHKGGNAAILTYDFVHRSHIDIFGSYYPRCYPAWFADNWITQLYLPGRMIKVKKIRLEHTQSFGRRYSNRGGRKKGVVENDRSTLISFLHQLENRTIKQDPRKVISLVIWNNDTDWQWGVIRNAQLRATTFPDWSMHVYITSNLIDNVTDAQDARVLHAYRTSMLIDSLKKLGVVVRIIKRRQFSDTFPASLLNLLAVDDVDVDYVLARNGNMRLTAREYSAVSDWINTQEGMHCMRDHPRHNATSIVPGLWGVKTSSMRQILHTQTMRNFLKTWNDKFNRSTMKEDSAISFYDYLWTKSSDKTLCHDSISCKYWHNAVKFPKKRPKLEFVGKIHLSFQPISGDRTPLFASTSDCAAIR